MKEPVHNKNSKVYLNEESVFIIEWSPKVTLEKEDFKVVVDLYDEWSDGELLKVLHIFPKGASASVEARNYGARREKRAGAEAFVIEGAIQRNLFKVYRRLRVVDYPMREFSNKNDALNWLLQI